MADISYSRIPEKALERWKLVRNICGGGDSEALAEYLPYLNRHDHSAENAERNKAYKERAVLYNATGRTRDGLLGLAFRRDPMGLDTLPPRLEYLKKDCDGAGVSLYQQSQATSKDVLETGRHGLYVDFSQALSGPIIKGYKAEDIINWRATMVDGQTVLTLVVLMEQAEGDDGYAIESVEQWRELLLENGKFIVRLWRRPKEGEEPEQFGEDIIPRSVGGELDFIPFVFVGAQNNDSSIDEAPLFDIAYINRAHYRNSADYEDSVFLAGQPQPWMSGLDETWRDHLEKSGTSYLGSRAMLMLPAGGAFGIEQAQPNTLAKEAMDQKEAQMIALGARLIEATQANRSATESDNDKETSTSVLSMVCANVSEAYTQTIAWCHRYLDMTPDADSGYAINQDFTRMQAEPQLITALVGAWQSGAFAKPDLLAFLRRIGVVAVERTDEDIEGDLQGEGPQAGMVADPDDAGQAGESRPVTGAAVLNAPQAQQEIGPLIEAMTSALERLAPVDLAPLIEAINAREAATLELDVQPIADAVADALKNMPATVVNVPQQAAPTINVDATTTVHPQSINVEAPAITVESPTVNVEPAAVTVEAAPTPDVNVTVPVTVEKSAGKTGTLKKQADGTYSMDVTEKAE